MLRADEAFDSQPVDLVFLLLLPTACQRDQINALPAVARRLRDLDVLRRLRGATSTTELVRHWSRDRRYLGTGRPK